MARQTLTGKLIKFTTNVNEINNNIKESTKATLVVGENETAKFYRIDLTPVQEFALQNDKEPLKAGDIVTVEGFTFTTKNGDYFNNYISKGYSLSIVERAEFASEAVFAI